MYGRILKLVMAGSLAVMVLIFTASCKKLKAAAGNRTALEELFEENILNRTFVVHLAIDNDIDITSQYAGYSFVLTKDTSFYHGSMTGTRNGFIYYGTWACNEDFSKLSINLTQPSIPAEFLFINRAWKFTKKAFPIMELAPWGSTEPKVLHMQRL